MAGNTKANPLGGQSSGAKRGLLRGTFFSGTWAELKKVTWPSKEETLRLTIVVLLLSAFVGLLLGVADYAFSKLMEILL